SFADRDVDRLSVGEQQRAMIARALAPEPDVLLLDEPTSALDEQARDSIERTVAELGRSLGVSVVIVTHDPGQARRLAGWIVGIERGRAVRQGSASEVLP
ncbi:MAG: ABC transporter ATP-binding protein, partial [Thermoleophilia bacterium]|nr:ABC transporter ATP-binding protein [Thermoleophilia bacterium]